MDRPEAAKVSLLCRAALVLGWLLWAPLSLGENPSTHTDVYVFWAEGCRHCEREITFLKRLEAGDARIKVRLFELTRNARNQELFRAVVKTFGIDDPAVPLTVIGDRVWIGYAHDEQTGAELRARIDACSITSCPDSVARLIAARPPPATDAARRVAVQVPEKLHLPLFGDIVVKNFSLPVLTVVLGALDGFNPCAMWTLVFLIGLLLGMKDTLRMWVLGTAFIAGSGAVYFVFMAAWLNLLLFLGSLLLVRVVIGLVALGGGAWYLREYVLNKEEVCEVTAPEQRQRVFHRLRALAQERSFALAFLGILALAFLVNLVELICSAGIPAVYVQILTMSGLPAWQHYGYLLLYILVFMADDLVVFVTAMTTLRIAGLTAGYSRASHLIGGVVLVILGALMLMRPEWLMFG
jgi:hypothetical protein